MCVRVHTTPSPAHVYCPNARFSHKVRLKIDWKFLVGLLKCLSLTANKMAAKNNQKSQKQKSNKQRSSNIAPVATAEQRMRKGKAREREGKWGNWRLNSSTTRRLRRQLHLQLCLLSNSCGPRSVFVVCLCLSRIPPLSRSSRSRFGNFSFVITVSAVDASQWQANCYQAVWKRRGETERGIQQRLGKRRGEEREREENRTEAAGSLIKLQFHSCNIL